jgi:predicted ATPase
MQKINHSMQEVLKVAACLGAKINETLIAKVMGYPVCTFLKQGLFIFEHDILQKAAYNLIPNGDLELSHSEVGRRMLKVLNQEEIDRYIFVLLSQLFVGRRLIRCEKEQSRVANLCLHAGKKAAKPSTFRTASIYFNFGIELVKDRGWEEEYTLTLALYNAAAEMELCMANYEQMETLIQTVIERPHDKIQAKVTEPHGMGIADRQQQATHRA